MVTLAYIAVGANIGSRRKTIDAAIAGIDRRNGIRVVCRSDLIETEPIGGPVDQPKYLNGAIEVKTTLTARQLLDGLLAVESALGRVRIERWGPRVIDLDLVLFGDEVIRDRKLTIPHPHMHQRGFVLQPLAQIAPQARHPILNKTVIELLAELQSANDRPASS